MSETRSNTKQHASVADVCTAACDTAADLMSKARNLANKAVEHGSGSDAKSFAEAAEHLARASTMVLDIVRDNQFR